MSWLGIWACPLDRRSYEWLLAQWASGVLGEKPKTFPESTWRLCRAFYERGFELVAFRDRYGKDRILMPGELCDDYGLAVLPEEEVMRILDENSKATTPEMMDLLRERFYELVPQINLVPKSK